ncbi:hypothetical protein N9A89_01730 [Akkermansiaceae bacterium]|nr:hypothetical protein [bacterium]MDA7535764.1 hypothetical protein [Akkermansiaceae bacterium]MDA7648813.1 hypothetical protein [Akkermansiaceae bacterium]MDA7672326.1 hypothetical protein [Akkermansiaceae bacterium]MDA7863627.1 hypothetical protein [Akkermansiaceae bacterium]
MDHNRDNPLKRFSAFWIAILLVGCFGVACIILRPMTHAKVESAYEMIADERLATKAEIEKAQAAALNSERLEKSLKASAATLNQTPAAGAMPLPGASTN